MIEQLLDSDPLLGIGLEHRVEQGDGTGTQPRRLLVQTQLNLTVEGANVFIVKGQEATEQGVQQHAHRPDVCFGA